MKKQKTLLITTLLSGIIYMLLIPAAYAHCPVCTAAVGAGVAVSRFYGVDDSIVGVWIGAFIISMALWIKKWTGKKIRKSSIYSTLLVAVAISITFIPLYMNGLKSNQKIFGIDKMLFGIIIGAIVTYISPLISKALKKVKNGTLFPFQTIIITLLMLLSTSLILWWCIA